MGSDPLGNDFAFLKFARPTFPDAQWLIPSILEGSGHVAVIGYANVDAALAYTEDTEKYGKIPPSRDFFKDLFGEDEKFISPGPLEAQGRTNQSLAHRANAEKSTSGAPLISVTVNENYVIPPLFLGIRMFPFTFFSYLLRLLICKRRRSQELGLFRMEPRHLLKTRILPFGVVQSCSLPYWRLCSKRTNPSVNILLPIYKPCLRATLRRMLWRKPSTRF